MIVLLQIAPFVLLFVGLAMFAWLIVTRPK
jgi:hypothetical protein